MQTDTVGEVQNRKRALSRLKMLYRQQWQGSREAEDYAQIAEHTLDYEVEYLLYGNGSDRGKFK